MGQSEYYSVYVARGGDIIVILSSRVLGVWGTGRIGVKIRGFRIIFGFGGFRKWREGNYRYLHCENTKNDYK